MLPSSIQEVIKEEAKVLFDKDPFYNTADAVRSGYIEGATKWAEIACGFAEWLQEKRWFYFNHATGRWHYTFEQGTSMNKKEYEKHYTKTTSELLTLFIEQSKQKK